MLTKHNDLRRTRGSSDMTYMIWNSELARMASDWANRCVYQHGQPSGSYNSGFSVIGQNIHATTSNANPVAAIQTWFNEVQYYNYNSASCQTGQVCGHYTQVVWASSFQLGCGYKQCAKVTNLTNGSTWTNAWFLVCNYGPAGNYQGKKPYKLGPACTACATGQPYCLNQLCFGGNYTAVSDAGLGELQLLLLLLLLPLIVAGVIWALYQTGRPLYQRCCLPGRSCARCNCCTDRGGLCYTIFCWSDWLCCCRVCTCCITSNGHNSVTHDDVRVQIQMRTAK